MPQRKTLTFTEAQDAIVEFWLGEHGRATTLGRFFLETYLDVEDEILKKETDFDLVEKRIFENYVEPKNAST